MTIAQESGYIDGPVNWYTKEIYFEVRDALSRSDSNQSLASVLKFLYKTYTGLEGV